MGSKPSSRASSEQTTPGVTQKVKGCTSTRGRKSEDSTTNKDVVNTRNNNSIEEKEIIMGSDDEVLVVVEEDDEDTTTTESEIDSSFEEDDDSEDEDDVDDDIDEEYDEFLAERLRIMEDARNLKQLAVAFLHPEKPVCVTDSTVYGRNYFERPSAPQQEDADDADERVQILADALELKKLAIDYAHPEVGVTATDPTVFGRNYFERPSAPLEQEEKEDAEERIQILADALALKKAAFDYMHPEVGVTTTDATLFGRNYFERPSAPEQEDVDVTEERIQILADAMELKKLAVDYMHPEIGVTTTDPTVFGRNYFERPSAPEQDDADDADERVQVLADAAALKKLAVDYMHPEVGVTATDPTVFGRNYFERPSAPQQEDADEAEERAMVLADAAALKKLAADYMHPEVGVTATDPTVFGRNYFGRPSAPEQDDADEADERAQVLADAMELKKLAVDYLHPEVGVTATDPTVFGRNYFNRPSAPEQEDADEAEERAMVVADAAALKKLAADYMHPEVGVTATNPTLFGRNYFNRPSAPEQEDADEADERAQVLADAMELKKLAADYLHPEVGVTVTDPTVFGRNYFERPSAPEQDDADEADERVQVLADAAALKSLAVDYMHPEVGVTATDPTLFGRNYFNRPSAPEQDDADEAEDRAMVLADAAALKKLAADYMHPEVGVTASDPTVFGRNYFSRPSAPEQEDADEAEERARVLADATALKKLAVDYAHPEVGVSTTDPTIFGRNYFGRPSAPEHEDAEEAEEKARVLADAAALKKLATDYMHPELGVTSTDPAAFGRNYYTRHPEGFTATAGEEVRRSEVQEAEYGNFKEVREKLTKFIAPTAAADKNSKLTVEDAEEGELHKSPSSVMLFNPEEAEAF